MKALLIVDIQNDFLPGGALPVPEGDAVISVINELLKNNLLPRDCKFDLSNTSESQDHHFDFIIATKDWHPKNHKSFAVNHQMSVGEHIILNGIDQILWPVHCVQGTFGAEFAAALNVKKIDKVIYKGSDPEIDSYSAFFDNGHLKETGLREYLEVKGVTDLYVVGLATDYCVKYTVLDALKLGFKVWVVVDGCRGVNLMPGDSERALAEIVAAGGGLVCTS